MGPRHQTQPIVVQEGLNSVPPEEIARSPGRNGPAFNHLRVGPQQIAHHSFLRHLPEPVYLLQIVKLLDVGRKSSVDAEDLIVNDSRYGEEVEDLSKSSPDVERSILFDALVVKSVDLSDESGLMVASEQGYSVSVPYLEGQQEEEGLNAVPTPINIVAQKDVVGVWRIAPYFEELEQVVELPVNVTADGDRGSNFDNIGFIFKDLLGSFAQLLDGDLLNLFLPLDLLNDFFDCFPGSHDTSISNFIKLIRIHIIGFNVKSLPGSYQLFKSQFLI